MRTNAGSLTMRAGFLILAALLLFTSAEARVRLPRLLSDGMVLQRETKARVWGWASSGERVALLFQGHNYRTTADASGNWAIQLPPQRAGGPFEMTFISGDTVTIENILFGDVWICSGQSNMELMMERVRDRYPKEIAQGENPHIRQFLVPDKYDFEKPHDDVESGEWVAATPSSLMQFSAVAYFFARDLYAKYGVPIGLINASLGGAPAQAWMSESALKHFPDYDGELQRFKNKELISEIASADKQRHDRWYGLLDSTDAGLTGRWADPALNDSAWKIMLVPGYWADGEAGKVNGAFWFRREFTLPEPPVVATARLLLGRIVDADQAYINGEKIGATTYQYPPRRYEFPSPLLHQGKNSVALRVISSAGRGGFVPDKPYRLILGPDTVDLRGEWKWKPGTTMEPLAAETFIRWKAAGLFNAMIAPLLNYTIKGAIWYQGEANTSRPSEYEGLMRTLISDWRTRWKEGDFPFLFVQLPNFMEVTEEPVESAWAALRDAQRRTLALHRTAMAVTIDLGEWNDIHPLNKLDVGGRLALLARRAVYGERNLVASGPLYRSMKARGDQLVLSFDDCGGGLVAGEGGQVGHFVVAGTDGRYLRAQAGIRGNQIVVRCDSISKPISVRYAWANNPQGDLLRNKEGLPASPFEATLRERSIRHR